MSASDQRELERINAQLKETVLRRLPAPGTFDTDVNGLTFFRKQDVDCASCSFGRPHVAIVVQGSKCAVIGAQEYRYGENQYLITGVDMPSSFYILNPSPEKPFLAVSLDLDGYLLTQLAAEVPPSVRSENRPCQGVTLANAEPDLLGAFLRLTDLLDKPEQIPVRAPIIIREIHYLLLIGPGGNDLRQLNTLSTQSNQIAQAISWLRKNYRESLQVDELARRVNMATSTFHRHFKEITGLSPLQYHKRLRLYEAQRLMLTENHNASSASLAVGYESGTQFNREYKRLFGEPPHRDMSQRRVHIQ